MTIEHTRNAQQHVVGRQHAGLDGERAHVLEQERELLTDDLGKRRVHAMHAERGLHRQRGRHRHAVHAVQREDPKVQLDSGSAGRVGARDRERGGSLRRLGSHAGRLAQRAAALLFAVWLPLATAAEAPTVIVLSWDGTRWDYPDRTELPALGFQLRVTEATTGLLEALPRGSLSWNLESGRGERHPYLLAQLLRGRGPPAGGRVEPMIQVERVYVDPPVTANLRGSPEQGGGVGSTGEGDQQAITSTDGRGGAEEAPKGFEDSHDRRRVVAVKGLEPPT